MTNDSDMTASEHGGSAALRAGGISIGSRIEDIDLAIKCLVEELMTAHGADNCDRLRGEINALTRERAQIFGPKRLRVQPRGLSAADEPSSEGVNNGES